MKGKDNYWLVLAGSGKSAYFVLAGSVVKGLNIGIYINNEK
jgi:hypothetical protein